VVIVDIGFQHRRRTLRAVTSLPQKFGSAPYPALCVCVFMSGPGRERNDPISNSVVDLELVLVFDEFWMSEKSFFTVGIEPLYLLSRE